MKKLDIVFITVLILSVSCQKIVENHNEYERITSEFEFKATVDKLTRTIVNDDMSLSWENGDALFVVTEDEQWGKPQAIDGNGSTIQNFIYNTEKGTFSCSATEQLTDEEHNFKIFYASESQRCEHRGKITRHTLNSTQNQDCLYPLAHIKENDALFGQFSASTPFQDTPSFRMSHCYALMKINIKNIGVAGNIEKLSISMDGAYLAGTSVIDFTSGKSIIEDGKGSNMITVNLTNGDIDATNGEVPVYFVMEAIEKYSGRISLTVTADGKTYTTNKDVTNLTFAAGSYNSTAFTICLSKDVKKGIYTAEDFIAFAKAVNADKNEYKALTDWAEKDGVVYVYNDLNLEGKSQIIWRYDGILDGLGHKISGCTLSATSTNVGLVADLRGTLRNITLENDCTFTQGSKNEEFSVGSLAGTIGTTGRIIGCNSFAKVIVNSSTGGKTRIKVGGIVGSLTPGAIISVCSFNGQISVSAPVGGELIAGGIVGLVNNGNITTSIEKCSNSCEISLKELQSGKMVRTGGIVGIFRSANSLVSECINTGKLETTVTAANSALGGICGFVDIWDSYKDNGNTTIIDCCNKGEIILHSEAKDGNERPVGGIVGKQSAYSEIKTCHNYGSITNDSKQVAYCGGIVGSTKSLVSRCHNHGKVLITSAYNTGMAHIGGVAGYADNSTTNSKIEKCSNLAEVNFSGTSNGSVGVGGIVGRLSRADVSECRNTGTIVSTKSGAGSIVGWLYNPASGTEIHNFITSCKVGGKVTIGNTETVLLPTNFAKHIYGGKPSSGVNVTISDNSFAE